MHPWMGAPAGSRVLIVAEEDRRLVVSDICIVIDMDDDMITILWNKSSKELSGCSHPSNEMHAVVD